MFTGTNTGNDRCKQICSTYKNTWVLKGSQNGILHFRKKNTEKGVTVTPGDSQVQAAQNDRQSRWCLRPDGNVFKYFITMCELIFYTVLMLRILVIGMLHCVQCDVAYPDAHSECWNMLNNALHRVTSQKSSILNFSSTRYTYLYFSTIHYTYLYFNTIHYTYL